MSATLARAQLEVPVDVRVVRRPTRVRCPACRRRRVLYAVHVGVSHTDGSWPALENAVTEARCASCWGMR